MSETMTVEEAEGLIRDALAERGRLGFGYGNISPFTNRVHGCALCALFVGAGGEDPRPGFIRSDDMRAFLMDGVVATPIAEEDLLQLEMGYEQFDDLRGRSPDGGSPFYRLGARLRGER